MADFFYGTTTPHPHASMHANRRDLAKSKDAPKTYSLSTQFIQLSRDNINYFLPSVICMSIAGIRNE